MLDKTRSSLLRMHRLWKRHSGVLCRRGVLAVVVLAGVFLNVLYAGETAQADSVRSRTMYRGGGSAGEGSAVEDANAASELARYRIFTLRQITADKAQAYLAQARIGTVSKLPGTSMILVTADPRGLLKATAVIGLIDSKQEYTIRQLGAASVSKDIPTNDRIQAELGDIMIGNFYDPPMSRNKSLAIIDIHNNSVVAIAPAEVQDRIAAVVEQLRGSDAGDVMETAIATLGQATEPPKEMLIHEPLETGEIEVTLVSDTPEQPAEENGNGSGSLFENLLRSLEEAEREMAVSRTPIEPNIVELPTEVPGVEEAPVVETQPTDQVDMALILQKLNALEAAMAAKQMPTETLVDKVVLPAEVNEVNEPLRIVSSVPADIPNADDVLQLDLPNKIKFDLFLALVGESLGFDFLYDPLVVKGDITMMLGGKRRGSITVGELYQYLEAVLKFHGYAMTRRGNLAIIGKTDAASVEGIDAPIVGDGETDLQVGDIIVKRVFNLKHIDTASAKNLLEGAKLGLNITEVPAQKTLLVTGYGYRMERIKQLLDMVDKPGKPKLFRFRKLNFTTAVMLVPKIQTLVQQLGEISITVGKPTAAPTPPKGRIDPRKRITKKQLTQTPPRGGSTTLPKTQDVGVYLDFDERTNRILMIGFEEDLVTVNELIDTLDVKKQDLRTIRVYEIQYVDAEEVRTKLQELGIIGASQTTQTGRGRSGRISQTTGRRDPRTSGTTGAAKGAALSKSTLTTQTGTNEGPLVEEPQVIIIETTNSLLVNATDEQHLQIAMIIGHVDSETQLTTIPYVVYPLENQDPEELAATLNKLIQETTSKQDKEGKTVSSVVRQRTDDEIIIIPDASTYSLIVYASKKNQQWVSTLIEQLDEYRAQVLLDVTLVTIDKADNFSFDLDWAATFTDSINMQALLPILEGGEEHSDFGGEKIAEATFDSGRGKGFYRDSHIQVLLDTIQNQSYGRILATPKLLVNDNQEGVLTIKEITYVERSRTDVIGTDNPQTQTSTVFDSYDAGLTLTIAPHISKGSNLRLEISLERSAFDQDTTEITKPPDTSAINMNTVITVPDESTIILGGLETVSQSKSVAKVPLLGDLPFIGGLFRKIDRIDQREKLYIFIRAHILRPNEDLSIDSDIVMVSARNRAAFERDEKEMQEYQLWPGIKDAPMEPLKVLEVD